MNLSKKHIKSNQDGRSLLEIILVIIIMCLLTLGGMYLYNYSVDNRNADLIYEDILVHSEHLRNKGKARNKSVYDSSLGDYTRTGSNIRSKMINEHSKIFTVTVENLTTDLCSAFSQKSWPEERVARILLNDTEHSPDSINCEDIKNEEEFDLGVVFWSNLANEEDKKNPFILPSLCQDGCLECQKCENNVCVNDNTVCSGNSVCVKTSSRPRGECKVLCNSNEYYDGQSCRPCPAHAVCDGSPDYDCESGYYKTDAGECMLCPPMVGVSSCDSGGLICLDGYYKKNGACQLCPEPNRTYCQSEPSHNKNSDGCPMYRYEECSLGKSCVNNTCVCSPDALPLGADCSECAYSCVSGLSCENGVCVGDDPNIGEECQPACSSDQSCRSGQCVCNDDGSRGSSCSVNCPCDSGLECQDKNANGVGVCRQEEDNECENLPENEGDSCTEECGCGNGLYCVYGNCMSDPTSITCDDGKEVVCDDKNVCECQCASILTCSVSGDYLEVSSDCIQENGNFYTTEIGQNQYLCCANTKPSTLGEYCYGECGGCEGGYVCNSESGGGSCCPSELPKQVGATCHSDCGCGEGFVCENVGSNSMGNCQIDPNSCPTTLPSLNASCDEVCGCADGYTCTDVNSAGMGVCKNSKEVCCEECTTGQRCSSSDNYKTCSCIACGTLPVTENASCYEDCGCGDGYTCTDVNSAGMGVCKNSKEVCCEKCGENQYCTSTDSYTTCSCGNCGSLPTLVGATCYEDCGCGTGFTCSNVNSSTGMGICKQSKEVCCEKCGENQYCTSSDSYATCSCGNCGSLPASVDDTCYVDCGCLGGLNCYDEDDDGEGLCKHLCTNNEDCPDSSFPDCGSDGTCYCANPPCGGGGGGSCTTDGDCTDGYCDSGTCKDCGTLPSSKNASCVVKCGCGNNLTCYDDNSDGRGICQNSCSIDNDCPNGYCDEGTCKDCGALPSTIGTSCNIHCGCGNNLKCFDDNNDGEGVCKKRCFSSDDCPSDEPNCDSSEEICYCANPPCGGICTGSTPLETDDGCAQCPVFQDDSTGTIWVKETEEAECLACSGSCFKRYWSSYYACSYACDGVVPVGNSVRCGSTYVYCRPGEWNVPTGYKICGTCDDYSCIPVNECCGSQPTLCDACQNGTWTEMNVCKNSCGRKMIEAGFKSDQFSVSGNKITYTSENDMNLRNLPSSFNNTLDLSGCDLTLTQAQLYVDNDYTLLVHDLETETRGITLNGRLEANIIKANATTYIEGAFVCAFGSVKANKIEGFSKNEVGVTLEDCSNTASDVGAIYGESTSSIGVKFFVYDESKTITIKGSVEAKSEESDAFTANGSGRIVIQGDLTAISHGYRAIDLGCNDLEVTGKISGIVEGNSSRNDAEGIKMGSCDGEDSVTANEIYGESNVDGGIMISGTTVTTKKLTGKSTDSDGPSNDGLSIYRGVINAEEVYGDAVEDDGIFISETIIQGRNTPRANKVWGKSLGSYGVNLLTDATIKAQRVEGYAMGTTFTTASSGIHLSEGSLLDAGYIYGEGSTGVSNVYDSTVIGEVCGNVITHEWTSDTVFKNCSVFEGIVCPEAQNLYTDKSCNTSRCTCY